jgi:hypothetical protein
VDPDVLYVDDDQVLTAAGSAAAINMPPGGTAASPSAFPCG